MVWDIYIKDSKHSLCWSYYVYDRIIRHLMWVTEKKIAMNKNVSNQGETSHIKS